MIAEVLTTISSGVSKRLEDHEGWDPDWSKGVFHGLLRCSSPKCAEPVVVVGEYRIDVAAQSVESWRGGYVSLLRLRYAHPALVLLDCPVRTPEAVRSAVAAASLLVWADPGAAANRLRLATEELLTAQDVPPSAIVQGNNKRLHAHQRLERLSARNSVAAEALMAVKWIGNEGSHTDALTVGDVLDGAEMLGSALRALYDTSDEEVRRLVRETNNAKGVLKGR